MRCDLLGVCPRGDYGLCCIAQDIIGAVIGVLIIMVMAFILFGAIWLLVS
jgi:hypothetical protein